MLKRYFQQSFSTQLYSLPVSLLLILILAGCSATTVKSTTLAKSTPTYMPPVTATSDTATAAPTVTVTPTPTVTATATHTATQPPSSPISHPVAFHVTGISVSVNPKTTCDSSTVFTYSATIQVSAGTPGGKISYTWLRFDNVPMPTQSVTFSPGQTVKTVTTDWQNNKIWENGMQYWEALKVTSPNTLTSAKAIGTYVCNRTVTGISASVAPSVYPCTQDTATLTVTATITVSDSPGTVDIIYRWQFSDGQATTPVDITVPAGQTQITVTANWILELSDPNQDYTAKVVVTTPNSFSSNLATLHKSC